MKAKDKCLFQYLLNEMKFDLKVVYNNKTYTASEISKDLILKTHLVVGPNFKGDGWAYNMGPINGKKYRELPQKIYLATGKRYITQNEECKSYGMGVYTTNYWYYARPRCPQNATAPSCPPMGNDQPIKVTSLPFCGICFRLGSPSSVAG